MKQGTQNRIIITTVVLGSLFVSFNLAQALFVDYNSADGFTLDKGITLINPINPSEITLNQRSGATGNLQINNVNGDVQLRFGKQDNNNPPSNTTTYNFLQVKNSDNDEVFKVSENEVSFGKPIVGVDKFATLKYNNNVLEMSIGASDDSDYYGKGLIIRKNTANTDKWLNIGIQSGCGYLRYKNPSAGTSNKLELCEVGTSPDVKVNGDFTVQDTSDLKITGAELTVDGKLELQGDTITMNNGALKIVNSSGNLQIQSGNTSSPPNEIKEIKADHFIIDNLAVDSTTVDPNDIVTQGWVANKYYLKRGVKTGTLDFGTEIPAGQVNWDNICEVNAYNVKYEGGISISECATLPTPINELDENTIKLSDHSPY